MKKAWLKINKAIFKLLTMLIGLGRYHFDCPYWEDDYCSGYNCCYTKNCIHSKKYQPWIWEQKNGRTQ